MDQPFGSLVDAAVFAIGERVFVVGGRDNATSSPKGGVWTGSAPSPIAWARAGMDAPVMAGHCCAGMVAGDGDSIPGQEIAICIGGIGAGDEPRTFNAAAFMTGRFVQAGVCDVLAVWIGAEGLQSGLGGSGGPL